ncbi:MAG: MBL fold metallo-hydrolase [Solirubrobacterales bacterium]
MISEIDGVSGVHRLGGDVVNWYLVEAPEGLVAIDAGLPAYKETLEADLAAIGRTPSDVAAVLLTHSDGDHTGVAAELADAGATLFLHEDDHAAARKPGPKKGDASPVHILPYLWRPGFWRSAVPMLRAGGMKPTRIASAERVAPGERLDVPGRPLIVHTPGHTPGHCIFVFDDPSVAFVGDALCTKDPLTGRPGPKLISPAANESNEDAVTSLDAIEELDAETLVFGHGDPWGQGARAAVEHARAAMA